MRGLVDALDELFDARAALFGDKLGRRSADTLDKIKPENLRRQVATMAVLAYYLAEMPEPAVQKDELSSAKQARAKGNLDLLLHLPNSELGSRI